MWRHAWFKILVGLQLLNFAAMALMEQQRRTIWDKEATNAQQILDTRYFTEKTEANYRLVAKQLSDISDRLSHLQTDPLRQAEDIANQFDDLRSRVSGAHNEILAKGGDAEKQFSDFRERLSLFGNDVGKNAADAASQFADMRDRVTSVHQETLKVAGDAAKQFTDLRARLSELQREAANNASNAALIKDIQERVLHIEATLQKPQAADKSGK
jgi:hypothetical protein